MAVKDTTALIDNSTDNVNEGMGIAHETAASLETILRDIQQVSSIISQIAAMSVEQSESISHVSIGINEISQVVQDNSATSEECAAASQQLNSQAEMLKELVSYFKLKR